MSRDANLQSHNLPLGFRWLCAGFAVVGVVNLGTGLRSAQLGGEYAAIGVSFIPMIHVIASLGWGIGFLWAVWRLWRLRVGARRDILALTAGYFIFIWFWWALFARADYALQRWPFMLFGHSLLFAFLLWYFMRPSIHVLFRHASATLNSSRLAHD